VSYPRSDEIGGALRLHYNENTAGCSPAVMAALSSLSREDAAFYPDYRPIIARCEREFGVGAGWVQLTNGLDEGLHVVALWARNAHDRTGGVAAGPPTVIMTEPAFEMYDACAEAVQAALVCIPPEDDFRFPLDGVLAAITSDTRLIYLTDPNNPTGLALPAGSVESIAEAAPQALVLVDEAYADFSGRTSIGPPLDRRRNVIVGRTFAKAHGLAALRAGALIGHPDTLDELRRLLPPFSLNVAAVRAVAAALDDRAYVDWYVAESAESRRHIYAFCRERQWRFWPSDANFVLFRVGDRATRLVRALADRGILIRDKSAAPGCGGCVRMTAGVVAHTDRALAALEEILASRAD
jgi:histidinol-phosphate aminotransferase